MRRLPKKMFSRIKTIRSKLLILFLTIGLLPLIGLGVLNILSSYKDLKKEISEKLLLLAEAKEGQLFAYIDSIESRTVDFSSDGFIRERLNEISSSKKAERAKKLLSEHLSKNKKILDKTLIAVFVVDKGGKIAASTQSGKGGMDVSSADYFIKGSNKVSVVEGEKDPRFGNQDVFIASAPVVNQETGEFFGVIVNVFNTKKLYNIFSGGFQIEKGTISAERSQTKTLEAYLVNKENIMFVHPPALESAGHKHTPDMIADTLPVQKCLKDNEEFNGVYANYAGKEVIGASVCIVDMSWVLLSEISTEEAFAPIVKMQFRLGLSVVLLVIFVFFIALLFAGRISRSIKKLQHGTKLIAEGNLDYQVDIKTGDEIEQLGNAFNGMVEKVKTSYEKVNREKKKFKTLLESIGDGVVTIDRAWNIALVNRATIEISGWTEKEIIGKPFRDIFKFIRERDRKENLTFIENAMVTGKTSFMENHTILTRKDGKEIPVGDSAAPIFGEKGDVIGAIIIFRDTSKERMEQALKSDFAYASHQLRTPVTKALLSIELALGEKLRPETRELIEAAFLNTKSMSKLVGQLVTVSEIDQGELTSHSQPVKLPELFESLHGAVLEEAKEKGIKFIIEPFSPEATIDTDRKKLQRALSIIIENAVKYNSKGGEVRVKTRIQDNELLITIRDTGVGIPTETQAIIFTKFFRGGNIDTTEIIGAGLGLFIAREYIRLLGGKIWFKSEENKGTEFSILLSLKKNG